MWLVRRETVLADRGFTVRGDEEDDVGIVTISRETGSGGEQIARQVCALLQFTYFDKALMAQVARERGISAAGVLDFSEDGYRVRTIIDALFGRSGTPSAGGEQTQPAEAEPRLLRPVDEEMAVAFVTATIRALKDRGGVVVVGRGGQAVLRGVLGVLHVRVVAPAADRALRLTLEEGLGHEAAATTVQRRDRATAEYLRRYHKIDWADPALYHFTVNSSLLGLGRAAELIADAARRIDARPARSG